MTKSNQSTVFLHDGTRRQANYELVNLACKANGPSLEFFHALLEFSPGSAFVKERMPGHYPELPAIQKPDPRRVSLRIEVLEGVEQTSMEQKPRTCMVHIQRL